MKNKFTAKEIQLIRALCISATLTNPSVSGSDQAIEVLNTLGDFLGFSWESLEPKEFYQIIAEFINETGGYGKNGEMLKI